MRRCTLLLCIVALVVLAHPGGPAVALSPAVAQVEVRAVANKGASVTADFQVWDAAGQAVLDLDKSQVQVVEDGTPAPIDNLQLYTTTEQTPTLVLSIADSKPYTLTTTGATIGIVFDAAASGPANLKKAREAIQQFLFLPPDYTKPRTQALVGSEEYFSLFIPSPGDQQRFQPPEFDPFTNDRNKLWDYIRQLTPISGATPLNGALQKAIQATTNSARARHTRAVVLVLSDGQDSSSGIPFGDNLKLARDSSVQLVIFGVGSSASLQKGWGSLDSLTKQYNITPYSNPQQPDIEMAFTTFARPTPASLFRARYTARLPLGQKHSFAVQVNRPDGPPITSEPFSYNLSGLPPASATPGPAANNSTALQPSAGPQPRRLSSILGAYFLLAGALAVLAALLVVSAVGLVSSRSLDRAPTKH